MVFSALINFSESEEENEPMWHGYLYAFLMLVCAQLQSFLLGQYFMKMMLVGLQIRTGVISAVYRKVRKLVQFYGATFDFSVFIQHAVFHHQ